MSSKFVVTCAVVCAPLFLLCAGNTSAQWSKAVRVSAAVEPMGNRGQNLAGVSTARCGDNVVVGFGDSEANGSSANSLAGYAVSSDRGKTFTDKGVLPQDPTDNYGFGGQNLGTQASGPEGGGTNVRHDVSVACANAATFYYAAPLMEGNVAPICPGFPICSSISVSISNNGGQTWGLPNVVERRSIDNHQLDFPSIAVDPVTPKRMYVAYWDENGSPNDSDFISPDCSGDQNVIREIKVGSSSDGGKTWAKHIVDHACDFTSNPEAQGTFGPPNVVVSPGGKIYVTYEFQAFNGSSNEIRFTRSLDYASTFSTPIVVSTDAITNAVPRLAVDRTTSKFRGAIYLTWSGMPRATTTEVLMSESFNLGASFSFPRSVRSTSQGTQVSPVVAVDNDGQVTNCFYMTGTNTPTSSSNYFYNCSTSFNHGATWPSYQKLVTSAPPGFNALTSDFLLHNDGFFTAYEVDSNGTRFVNGQSSDEN